MVTKGITLIHIFIHGNMKQKSVKTSLGKSFQGWKSISNVILSMSTEKQTPMSSTALMSQLRLQTYVFLFNLMRLTSEQTCTALCC